MELSQNGLKLIKQFEGCKLYWYDLGDGGLTSGYGTFMTYANARARGHYVGQRITQATADANLKNDCAIFVKGVNSQLTQYGFKVNQNQFDALVSYAYNRGLGNSIGTNGLRQLLKNSKTVADISNNLIKYWGSNSKYRIGLLNRRREERILFNTPMIQKTANVVKKNVDWSKKGYYTKKHKKIVGKKTLGMYADNNLKMKLFTVKKGESLHIVDIMKKNNGCPVFLVSYAGKRYFVTANKKHVSHKD